MKLEQVNLSLGSLALWIGFLHSFVLNIHSVSAQTSGGGGTCSDATPCLVGCCSKDNQCGFTDDHCGEGCKSNCNATAECGEYAAPGESDCPINVCCSKWGFCGVTEDFCGSGCQPNSKGGGCGDPTRPSCAQNTDALSYKRRIGYYELFNVARPCLFKEPENLVVDPLTHVNLAFVNFGSDYKLIDDHGDIVQRVSFLKFSHAGLRVNVAIGGWDFNDPPTSTYWSDMASSYPNRETFINSVVKYLQDYHLDGVDLDWEYPSADDRGGIPDDADNLVVLVAQMREAFDRENPGWEISVTLPTSYWYLRGFNLEQMQKYVNYFNLMSYDLHGMWDHDNKWTGPYLKGHTDISEIDLGLDLLWRNNIDPANVVFGMAFYGRSFTMADPNCYEPNDVCEFASGGLAGSCSDTVGILTYTEIAARNYTLDVQTFYDPKTTVKYNVYNGNQWISYDDEESFFDKKRFVSERCLSGIMIWALDQDTDNYTAISGLMGDFSLSQMEGGGLDSKAAEALADTFSAYTGQKCFVTPRCTDGSTKEKNPDQVCPDGFMSVDTAHSPIQAAGHDLFGDCSEGWYRHICCPKTAMPKNCEWNGAPQRSEFGCEGKCGSNQFKLNEDGYLDAKGEGNCFTGSRYLCCDSTAVLSECIWTGCQGPLFPETMPQCPKGYDFQTYRYDKPDGSRWCSDEYVSPVDGSLGSPLHDRFKSALCCPTGDSFGNCGWTNDLDPDEVGNPFDYVDMICKPRECRNTKTKVAAALDPPQSPESMGPNGISCAGVTVPPGHEAEFSYCCDPPSKYNEKWPVDPKYLWEHYYDDPKTSDVVWSYSDEYENNDKDPARAAPGAEDGSDAYGFVMLDGPDGSIDNQFATTQTVVRRTAEIPKVKRSVLTTNQTVLDSVFDHSEEIIHVYCNYPAGSKECQRIFIDGAEDTIIGLPSHVGEGPFARIVSMKLAAPEFQLPKHHIEHRSLENNENPVYELKIDYNFHLIKAKRADDPVNMRVDYTNLLGYWSEMTDSPATRMKRGLGEDGLTGREWRDRVQRAVVRDKALRKRSAPDNINFTTPIEFTEVRPQQGKQVEKRWYGLFLDWLNRLTTVTKKDLGVIPLGWASNINLFNAQWGCPGQTFSANLRMDLEANMQMDATYAYYLSASFIPPGKPDTFAYFGMQPSAYLGLRMVGNAQMQATTGRKKIIDTLSYPGLAVKGIAAVGPTLDVYGEIRGKITLHGEARAGAEVSFGKAEVFWPQNDDAQDKYQKLVGIDTETKVPAPGSVAPTFEAGVAVDAQLDIIVTPEANVGIKIGGGKLVAGATLMDAQLTGYVLGDLSFQAHGDYSVGIGNDGDFNYRYGVYILYNVGYKAKAKILNFIDWALEAREAFSPAKSVTIFERTGSISMTTQSKRDLSLLAIDASPSPDIISGGNASLDIDSFDALSLNPEVDLIRRADGSTDPNPPQFSQNLKCPPGSKGDIEIPEIRFNCQTFSPVNYDNNHQKPGLCGGYRTITGGLTTTLTYSQDNIESKRSKQCPSINVAGKQKGYCFTQQDALNTGLGRSGNTAVTLECDEFPWASSEEGGIWLPSNKRSSTCIPSYQNNWHGQCIRLFGEMQSNWGQLEPVVPDGTDRKDNWKGWREKAWSTAGDSGPAGAQNTQRLTQYPDDQKQPPPDGNPTRDNEQQSWVFKRNYTWSLIDDATRSDSWWGASSYSFLSSYSGSAGLDSIICAINIFDQTNVYKLPRDAKGNPYNARCKRTDGNNYNLGGVSVQRHGRCLVEFANSNSNTKRSTMGTWAGWEVERVTMLDDDDENSYLDEMNTDSNSTSLGDGMAMEI